MRIFKRIRDLLSPRFRNQDIQDELEVHFEAIVDEYKKAGLPPEEARLAARRRFGSTMLIKDRGHDVRGGRIEGMLRDVRHASRRLVHAPAFSIAAILTLALAIGANASIFTVVHRVVWNPLPYASPDRLIALDYGIPVRNINSGLRDMTWQLYWQLADRAHTIESIAVFDFDRATLTGRGDPERLLVSHATSSLSHVLGVSPAAGRWFTDDECVPGAAPAVVLSHGFWMRRFGGDSHVLGSALTIDGARVAVVGIMPASFTFPDARIDVWMPAQSTRADASFIFKIEGVARLRDGVTVGHARAEMTRLIGELAKTSPNQQGIVSAAVPLQEIVVGNVARALWTLLASVGVVLLIACANVANLFLVRYESRQREIALRRALGAGRRGIISYFFAESALLSAIGGVLGLGLAWAGVRFLVMLSPANLPRLEEVHLDGTTVLFTVSLSLITALVFCAIPLLRLRPVTAGLHETGRGSVGRGHHRGRHILMAAQIALALTLLVGSGLMIRSFEKLRAVDPGFDSGSQLTFTIGLSERRYPTRRAAVAAHQAILEKLAAIPGVKAVSATSCLPLSGACFGNGLRIEGETENRGLARGFVWFRAVAGGYFEAMGMRMLRGRALERGDVERGEANIVVNQAFANVYFPGRDPIGERVQSSTPPNPSFPAPAWMKIVGIVANTPVSTLAEAAPAPQIFMPMSIAGGPDIPIEALIGPNIATLSYVLRAATPASELAGAVRAAVSGIDPDLPLSQVRTMQNIVDRASEQMVFTMTLLAIAASVALLMGMVGVYGVVSYVVSQRTSEIGVRLALGAEPGGVSAMIVRQGGSVALAGAAVGLTISLGAGQFIQSLLYGISPRDPMVLAVTTATLMAIALIACWFPARRAARINPVDALRAD
jgi:putative ABC transport system permease protein